MDCTSEVDNILYSTEQRMFWAKLLSQRSRHYICKCGQHENTASTKDNDTKYSGTSRIFSTKWSCCFDATRQTSGLCSKGAVNADTFTQEARIQSPLTPCNDAIKKVKASCHKLSPGMTTGSNILNPNSSGDQRDGGTRCPQRRNTKGRLEQRV